MFSLVTNACLTDGPRLASVIPHWLRVFGGRLTELLIVFDTVPASGRIATLHGTQDEESAVRRVLERTTRLDSRIRVLDLPSADGLDPTLSRWFGPRRPIRCQAGTPIAAFVYAIDAASQDLVLRADCDMFFFERGWLDRGAAMLRAGIADLVEPPRLGDLPPKPSVSTRALMLLPRALAARAFPISAYRLDPLRRLHRWMHGRPTWLALEQMLDHEVQAQRLRHTVLNRDLGHSMHVASRSEMEIIAEKTTVQFFEQGFLPSAQRLSWNYIDTTWEDDASIRRQF